MPPAHSAPTRAELFSGFFKIGLQGFGGVLPWARRTLVDERGWLTDAEFTEVLGLGQILPGPNIVNLSVVVGQRFHGGMGAMLAIGGLMLAPMLIVLALAIAYDHFSQFTFLQHMLSGISAVAAGLVVAMAVKLAMQMERAAWCLLLGVLAFLGVALLRLPLFQILLVLAPVGIAIGYATRSKGGAQ